MHWHYFDKVYCISVTERTDRRMTARREFERVGLENRVEFVIVEKHPVDCEQGIYESHLHCIRKGLEAGAERILIFEDDIIFDRFDPDVLKNCVNFMLTSTGWHMLCFGCMVKTSYRTGNPSVMRITYRSLTHAIVYHRRFAETLVRMPWRGIPYDDTLRDLRDEHFYAAWPSFAFQSDSRSDNERYLPLDRFRRFCGGLRRLQKFDEFYHRYRTAIIALHVAIAAGIAVLLIP